MSNTVPTTVGTVKKALLLKQPQMFVIIIADAVSLPEGMAATQRLLCLARGLQDAGAEVEVLLLRPTEVSGTTRNSGVQGEARSVPYRYTPGTSALSPRWIGRRAQEIRGLAGALSHIHRQWLAMSPGAVRVLVYSRHLSTVAPVALWCRRRDIPVALELCEWPETQPAPTRLGRWRKHLFCRHCVRFADGVVPISRYIEECVKERARGVHKSLAVLRVPILVDVDEPFQEVSLPFSDSRYVLYSGSDAYQKTIEFVIAAFQLSLKHQPDLRLVITGLSQSANHEQQRRVHSLGISSRVLLPGFIPRNALLTAFRKAEALLIPLFGDTQSQARFPSKLGEYLLSGRPVVTSATGEIPALLSDRQTAFLAPPDSLQGYVGTLIAALTDPAVAHRVGEAGRQVAIEKLDYRYHGRQLAQWILELSVVRTRADH
jgi:glycosyltransferase involved in cell wall biosynthesis